MTKAEVIKKIAENTGVAKKDIETVCNSFFEVIKDSIISGEHVYFRGFVTFRLQKRAAKIARNISKNTAVMVPEHYIVSINPGKTFSNAVRAIKVIKEEESIDEQVKSKKKKS